MANENEKKWYFAIDGRTSDPMTFEELRAFVRNGELLPDTFVFNSDESEKGWQKASDTKAAELFAASAGQMPPPPFPGAQAGASAEFTVGGVLSRAWTMMWKKPLAFMGLTFLSFVIAAVFAIIFALAGTMIGVQAAPRGSLDAGTGMIIGLLTLAVYSLVALAFQCTITHVVFRVFMSGAASVWESMKRSISRVGWVSAAGLQAFLAGVLLFLVCSMLLISFEYIIGAGTVAVSGGFGYITWAWIIAVIGGIIGTIVFLVVGSVFFVKWIVFAPACVIERLGSTASLRRSSELTQGYRLKIFGIFILVLVILVIFQSIAGFLVGKLFGSRIISSLLSGLINLIPWTFSNVLIPVIYYSLRVTKEQLTPESLADIFA